MFLLLNVLDVMLTLIAVEAECNPIASALLVRWGLAGFVVAKLALVLYFGSLKRFIGFLHKKSARIFAGTMCGIYLAIVLWNMLYLLGR